MSKYTQEEIDFILAEYKEAQDQQEREETVDFLAQKFDSSPQSIRQILSNRGVYIRKKYVNKLGKTPIKKEDFVTLMEKYFSKDLKYPDQLETFSKVNKNALFWLMGWVVEHCGDSEGIFEEVL